MDRNPHTSAEIIGKRLEIIREMFGYKSKKDFCEALNISTTRYGNWTSGYRRVSIDEGLAICERFNISLDWPYRGELKSVDYDLGVALKAASAEIRTHE